MHNLEHGRARFARALQILRGEPPATLKGWTDTPRNRLRWAVLEVYPCTPDVFPRKSDYYRFAVLMVELRDHSPTWSLFDAMNRLDDEAGEDFAARLEAIAESTIRHFAIVPNTPWSAAHDADGGSLSQGA